MWGRDSTDGKKTKFWRGKQTGIKSIFLVAQERVRERERIVAGEAKNEKIENVEKKRLVKFDLNKAPNPSSPSLENKGRKCRFPLLVVATVSSCSDDGRSGIVGVAGGLAPAARGYGGGSG